jgi:hypothetical protein
MMSMPRFTPRVLAVACALLAFRAGGAAAETAVGVEARGVDPMVALLNSQRLDLRDELGRPVSAKLVAAQLKAAQASASVDAAFISRLPEARLMARALDLWQFSLASIGAALPLPPWRELWALPGPKSSSRAAAAGPVLLAVWILSCGFSRCSRSCLTRAFTGAAMALRC